MMLSKRRATRAEVVENVCLRVFARSVDGATGDARASMVRSCDVE
jgi:hypothetical protein